MTTRAQNYLTFHRKGWLVRGPKVTLERIVNDILAFVSKFVSDFGWSLFVAGAVFGDVGG